jgi:hypothetical protein
MSDSPRQQPVISDEFMLRLLKQLLIAGTGGYNDTPLQQPDNPYVTFPGINPSQGMDSGMDTGTLYTRLLQDILRGPYQRPVAIYKDTRGI